MKKRDSLTVEEFINLMLETLSYKQEDIDSEGKTFYMYGYKGSLNDLFRLMEKLAINKGIIEEKIKVRASAWGSSGYILHGNSTTNFNPDEVNKIYEAVHRLINRGIISPGAEGNYGVNLPYFHVTEYGVKCIDELEILPFDIDGYLEKLKSIDNLDEWIKFYIGQALECFNNNCYESSLIMVGLANELITQQIIDNYLKYLDNIKSSEKCQLEKKLSKEWTISNKYLLYRNHLKSVAMKIDPQIKKMSYLIDNLANETFMSYMRLSRNELAHPSEIRTDRITILMIFISFLKYCERQYIFINYFFEKSE